MGYWKWLFKSKYVYQKLKEIIKDPEAERCLWPFVSIVGCVIIFDFFDLLWIGLAVGLVLAFLLFTHGSYKRHLAG